VTKLLTPGAVQLPDIVLQLFVYTLVVVSFFLSDTSGVYLKCYKSYSLYQAFDQMS